MSPHPRFEEFYEKLRSLKRVGFGLWQGNGFRAGLPKWMSRPYRMTGVGSILSGGRFNPPQLIPAVYFATSAETLKQEADQKANRYGWAPEHLRPQTRIVADLTLQAVLDLTDETTLASLKVRATEILACEWQSDQEIGREALTQALGRAVFELGGEGIVAASARHFGGTNLVYFPNNARPGSTIVWHGEDDIPFVHGL